MRVWFDIAGRSSISLLLDPSATAAGAVPLAITPRLEVSYGTTYQIPCRCLHHSHHEALAR